MNSVEWRKILDNTETEETSVPWTIIHLVLLTKRNFSDANPGKNVCLKENFQNRRRIRTDKQIQRRF